MSMVMEGRKFLLLFGSALKAWHIYPPGHPGAEQSLIAFYRSLLKLLSQTPQVEVVFLPGEIALGNVPQEGLGGAMMKLAGQLSEAGVNRITLRRGVSFDETSALLTFLNARLSSCATQERPELAHVTVEGLSVTQAMFAPGMDVPGGSGLYDSTLLQLKAILTSEETFGAAHLKLAREIVAGITSGLGGDSLLVESLYFLRQHDDYTLTHAVNVCGLAVAQAKAIGLPEQAVSTIGVGALLHDVGKRSVPREVLVKPGRLTEAEFAAIKGHPLAGARHLCTLAGLPDIVPLIACEHHLRFDGKGYPNRGGRRPNLGSQIVQVADVYDALRTDRPYRAGMGVHKTLSIMLSGSGTEFHPLLLRKFGMLIERQARLLGRADEADQVEGLLSMQAAHQPTERLAA